jgi:hypothetical protein
MSRSLRRFLFRPKPAVTLHRYADHEEYRRIQNAGNARKIDKVWAKRANIEHLARYVRLRGAPTFGICHGTRRGLEQGWFSEALGCHVIGTEIADSATQFPNTIQWDFHDAKPEWIEAADFIYSNSFDHSLDPEGCLKTWMSCIKPGGVCLIEHSDLHGPSGASELDPFGIELPEFLLAITRWGRGQFFVRELIEDLPETRPAPKFLCCVVIERVFSAHQNEAPTSSKVAVVPAPST